MKRASGVLMHVSSLWGDFSEGAFGKAAEEWIDFLHDSGFSAWQVLPFNLPDECNSPYKSYSAFSGNPFFIDLTQLAEQGLLTREELTGAKQRAPYACEFDRLNQERMALLARAAKRFKETEKLEAFMKAHPQTDKFCEYMARKTQNGLREWLAWTEDGLDEETLATWRFTQYEFFRQWAKIKRYAEQKGVAVIGDIPIYVSLDSADVWANPSQFLLDEDHKPSHVAGVPPDYFAADGQLWGNPLYDWTAMKKDGYAWWRERMAFVCELFDGVRIDHFRGFESYYAIPATEKTARNGKWVKGPGMGFINVVKEVCGDKLIIAEDLGDITPEVHKLVEDSGFPGMKVLQFAFLGDRNSPHLPHNYDNNCVAYTGTHDNNTLLGYVWELDENTRRRLLAYCGYEGSNWDACYDTILRTMFESHAGLLVLPVQDLLLYGSDTRFNKPGVAEGNWSFRVTKEQLAQVNLEKFRRWNDLYGRSAG